MFQSVKELIEICEKENKKIVDSLTAVCYSEKCYIMARYACLSKSTNGIML